MQNKFNVVSELILWLMKGFDQIISKQFFFFSKKNKCETKRGGNQSIKFLNWYKYDREQLSLICYVP